ncbi:MAG: heparinase II/III family protein [Fimbriimonadaceae bacterium]
MGLAALVVVASTLGASAEVAGSGRPVPLDPARVAAIAAALPETPTVPSPRATDRAAWTRPDIVVAASPATRAAPDVESPPPPIPERLYHEYFETGGRNSYQTAYARRTSALSTLAIAAAIHPRSPYVQEMEAVLRALCEQRTWVLPAHDPNRRNFNRQAIDIDLVSSDTAVQIATAVWLHEDSLDPDVVRLARSEVRRRVVDPFLASVRGTRPRDWWFDTTNNWLSVCLNGVVGAALLTVGDRRTRAEVVAAAEALIPNFLRGFGSDGYCSEGVAYWNYGFGRFNLLSERVYQATGGFVDFMAMPGAESAARYGVTIEMVRGVAPAFSDCDLDTLPSRLLVARIARRWSWATMPQPEPPAGTASLHEFVTYNFAPPPGPRRGDPTPPLAARTWFPEAGVYIGRPASQPGLAVAFKGGHNDEHHNHNDVGSYVVAYRGRAVLVDPGRENYTVRTFSARRYDSNLINSFGHPVPVVAGRLQSTGRAAAATVLRHSFSDAVDEVAFDLRPAYAVPALRSLERTFVYQRSGRFVVEDRMAASEPIAFETALITLGSWENLGNGRLRVSVERSSLIVQIDTGGAPFTVSATRIEENAPVKPTRIAVSLREPARQAAVRLTVTPESP